MARPPFEYLLEKSKHTLKDFELKQLADRANNWKQAKKCLEAAIQAEALALFTDWIYQYGEEFISQGSSVRGPDATQEVPDSPVPSEGKRVGREFWRSDKFFKKAG